MRPLFFRLTRGLLLVLALYLTVIALLAWDGWKDEPGPAEVVLILGTGGVNPDGSPTPRQCARLDRALEVARQAPPKIFLVSGAPTINGHDETSVMAAYLIVHGIDPARIARDPGGATTFDTARDTAAFLREHDLHGVRVVTHYFHMTRTRYALARFGVTPILASPLRRIEWRDFYALGREAAGWVIYRFYAV